MNRLESSPAAPLAVFEHHHWQQQISAATEMNRYVKLFARELLAYIHVFHSWKPTTLWSIGPGLEVGVFGAIAWVLLLFYKAVEDETVLLTHIYREFKHQLDAKRRANVLPPEGDKTAAIDWTLEERLMLHATMLIETFKPEVRAAKCKPQLLKVLKAVFPIPLHCSPIIRDRPADEKNVYGIIADHADYWMVGDELNSYWEIGTSLTCRTTRSDAKELGMEEKLSATVHNLVLSAPYHLLHQPYDINMHAPFMSSIEQGCGEICTPQQKIAAFMTKMISNNRAAAAAEAWRP
jgi:hypothetical protein